MEKTPKEKIEALLEDNPDCWADVLAFVAEKMATFQADCELKTNAKQENALGDALTLLSSDTMCRGAKAEKLVKRLSNRIFEVHFPDGKPKDSHSEGERDFFNRFSN